MDILGKARLLFNSSTLVSAYGLIYNRVLALLLSVSFIFSWFFTQSVVPEVEAYLFPWYFMGIFPIFIFILSYIPEKGERISAYGIQAFFLPATLYIIGLLHVNNYHQDFEIAMIAMLLVANLHFSRIWIAVIYNLICLSVLEYLVIINPEALPITPMFFALLIAGLMVFSATWRFMRLNYHKNLEEREKTLSKLFNSTPDAWILFQPGTLRIMDHNSQSPPLFGLHPDDSLIGRNLHDLISGGWKDDWSAWIKGSEELVSSNFEAKWHKDDKTDFWSSISFIKIDVKEGQLHLLRICDIDSIRKSHEELLNSNLQYREMISSLSEGVIAADNDNKVIYFNDKALQFLNLDPVDLTGSIEIPERLAAYGIQEAIKKGDVNGHGQSFEIEYQSLTGVISNIKINQNRLALGKGKGFGTIWSVSPACEKEEFLIHEEPVIMESAKANPVAILDFPLPDSEQKIPNNPIPESSGAGGSEEDYQWVAGILERGDFGLAMLTPELKFSKVNSALCAMLGYKEDDLLRLNLTLITHPEDLRNGHHRPEYLFSEEQTKRSFERRLICRDGSQLWVNMTTSFLMDSDGSLKQGIIMLEDITEKKRIELAIIEEKVNLSAIIENTRDAIFSVDQHHNITVLNTKFKKRFFEQHGRHINVGDNYRDMLSGESLQNWLEIFSKTMRGESPRLDEKYAPNTGSPLDLETSYYAIYSDKGLITGVSSISRDITARIQYEHEIIKAKEKAEAATAAKSDFLATMSHEIRTPLNGVIGMSELLKTTTLTQTQREYVDTVLLSSEALLTIINDILDYSKIESDMMELEQKSFPLQQVIDEAFEILNYKAKEKDLELIYNIEPDIPSEIIGDHTRLRQILVNLVSNAVKFTSRGSINIHVSKVADSENGITLKFSIKDTGIGIPPDKLERLFKPFSQAETSTTRQYGGTGLGLAICSRLVNLMKGDIWVDSRLGEGSTFSFTILTKKGEVSTISVPVIDAELLKEKNVLIVTDSREEKSKLKLYFDKWEIKATFTTSGKEAINYIRSNSELDLVMLDAEINDSAWEAITGPIREIKDESLLPIVLFNADTSNLKDISFTNRILTGRISKSATESRFFDSVASALMHKRNKQAESKEEQIELDEDLARKYPIEIMLAEDNPINQILATTILSQLGYKVDVANDGAEALELMKTKIYDLIFMDVQMPKIDGIEATKTIIRNYPPSRRPRIIAMTAFALEGDKEKCLEAGMDDYISKPIFLEALQRTIEKWSKPSTVNPKGSRKIIFSKEELIDQDAIKRLEDINSKVDSGFMQNVMNMFFEQAPKLIEEISEAESKGDHLNVGALAHKLKGTSLNLGAKILAQTCKQVEIKGKNADMTNISIMISDLSEIYKQTETELKKILEEIK